ncbi:MAG: hypothetical protein IT286_02475, partial [Proteobacteria bacterium]|nr:hypothetical protein [Pseudomonadota bacterium]
MKEFQGDKPKIKWAHWAWLLLTISFLFFRLQNLQGVFTRDGVIINDTDPYYRLHRVESMVKTGDAYPLHEKKLNSPEGTSIAWPLGLDILVSIPLKLYNSTSRAEIESFCAVIIPFLSLPLLWFSGWIGTSLGGTLIGILLGLFITCSSTLIYQTGLGRLDHHFIEATSIVMLLMFAHRFMQQKEKYLSIGLILILGLTPSFLAQGWILAPILIIGLLLDKKWDQFHSFSKIFFTSFILSVLCLSFSDRFSEGVIHWVSFSWWAPWTYLCSALFLEMIHLWKYPLAQKIKAYPLILKATFLTLLGFLLYKNPIGFLQTNVSESVDAVFSKKNTLAMTLEARSPFDLNLDQFLHSDTHILILAAVCILYFLYRRKHLFLIGFALFPVVLSFVQIRFMVMSLPLMFLIILLMLKEWILKIPQKAWKNGVLMTLACFVIIIPFKPFFGFTMIENVHYYFKPIRSFSFFLNQQYKVNNLTKGNDPIIAHWDYGHWLLYYTGLPVIANPFQGASAMEVLELFTSKGTDQFEVFLKKRPAKYMIIESGAQRTLGWIQAVGKDRDLYFEKVENIDGQDHFQTTPIYDDLFMYRYFFELGRGLDNNHPKNWRLIYSSPYPSPGEDGIPALKAFEHVKGLTIQLHSKRPHQKLLVQAEIHEKDDIFT